MVRKKAERGKRTYKTPEEMQEVIDDYFDACRGHVWINEDTGEPYCDKHGVPIVVDVEPPTITGLALALGFTNRQSLLNYQNKAEFEEVVTRAKLRVEHYAETRLYDKEGLNGAKFNLANNFSGWRESQEITHNGAVSVTGDMLEAMLDAAGYTKK